MDKVFKISRFILENEKFVFSHYESFKINFLKSHKPHLLRIVVEGCISKQTINVLSPTQNGGYKIQILKAISEYKNNHLNNDNVRKVVTEFALQQIYSKAILKNLKNYLYVINKEESRDKLTEYNLI